MPGREERQRRVKMRIEASKARYGAQTNVADPTSDRCCCCAASTARIIVNLMFVVGAILMFALGIWAVTGRFSGIFGALPGIGIVVLGAVLFVTAILGEYGARVDNKCILLVYFLVVLVCFLVFAISGIVVLAQGPEREDSIVAAWCAFPESAARGQVEFNCCGLRCPSDLPALGSCPDGTSLNGTVPECNADSSDVQSLTCALPAAQRPVTSTLPGCQSLAANYVTERIVPLFVAALVTGIVLLGAMATACRLLCKRTRPTSRGGGAADAGVSLGEAKDQGSDGWLEMPVTGGAAQDKGAGMASSGPREVSSPLAAATGAGGDDDDDDDSKA